MVLKSISIGGKIEIIWRRIKVALLRLEFIYRENAVEKKTILSSPGTENGCVNIGEFTEYEYKSYIASNQITYNENVHLENPRKWIFKQQQ